MPTAAHRWPLRAALIAVLALGLGAAPGALAAHKPKQRFFETPGGAIECELDVGGGLGVQAYCQTTDPPRSVTMDAQGQLKRCNGRNCIGNGPDNERTLADGHSIVLGPFRCSGETGAISCKVSDGKGFAISRQGVKRL